MIKQPRKALSIPHRAAARKAVQSHDGWDDYRRARGINASMLSRDVLYDAADFLGIDIREVVTAHNEALRAGAAKLFTPASPEVPASLEGRGAIDWQRVRTIAREEIDIKLRPVVVTQQVVVTPARKIETGDMVKHPMFDALVASLSVLDFSGNKQNVYLYGPTGTGKTYAAAQAAKLLGVGFYFHSTAQEAYDLIGYEKVSGNLMLTPFVIAFEHGGLVLLDEMDRYDEKALTVVNSALANGRLTLPDGREIARHPDFYCVGAGNTNGLGATADFTAATSLDKSTLSRFPAKLPWHVSAELEELTCVKRAANPALALLWLREVRAARVALDAAGLPDVADQRCLEAGAQMLAAGMALQLVRDITYLAGWDADQKAGIWDRVKGAAIKAHEITNAKDAA